jgi:hypothetical protein
MSILHYSDVTGPSREMLDDAFAATFFRLATRFPHLTAFRFFENGRDRMFEEYVHPESLISLMALDMALRLMRRINPKRIRIDQCFAWEKERVLDVRLDIPVYWLVPPLEVGFYLTAPMELWNPESHKNRFSAKEETWNVITQSRTLFSA